MAQPIPQVILIISAAVSLPMMLVLYILSHTYSTNAKGLKDCALAILLMIMAVPLLIGRGMINDFFSIVVANVLLIAAFIQMLIGIQKLASRPRISGFQFGVGCLFLQLFLVGLLTLLQTRALELLHLVR